MREHGKMRQIGLGTLVSLDKGQWDLMEAAYPSRKVVELHAQRGRGLVQVAIYGPSGFIRTYIFHRTANESQKPILAELLDPPPPVWAWCFCQISKNSSRCPYWPYKWVKNSMPTVAKRVPFLEQSSVKGGSSGEKRSFRSVNTEPLRLKGFTPLALPATVFHDMEVSQNQEENHGNMWRCTIMYHQFPRSTGLGKRQGTP